MFILYPDPYSLPCYRIGPFVTKDVAANAALPVRNDIDDYFNNRFAGSSITYTENGRKAIQLALAYYNLAAGDVVTILTTSGNFYISGCVTKEIEQVCRWSRRIEIETKLVFINHEFGYPYADLQSIKDLGFPIIEDCANTFYSQDAKHTIGTVGDFVIYSFPKIFPIQIGGILRCNIRGYEPAYQLDEDLQQYIKNVLSHQLTLEVENCSKRLHNHHYLAKTFEPFGCKPRFEPLAGTVPGVFMFSINDDLLDLGKLKNHFYAHGIQCSVFYGERSFFIPCHQALQEADLDYFTAVMKAFIMENTKNNVGS
jgi:Txe/YoeB family toxin of Txe-Axe toxin-antitoxin module